MTQSPMPPERELLLLCIKPRESDADRERIDGLLAQKLDWEGLLELATWHNADTLLHWRLRGHAGVPVEVAAKLEGKFQGNFRRNLFLTGQLVKIAGWFQDRQIPLIVYKGPMVAALYENLGLRKFGDLDLLVHEEDAYRAHELFTGAGFRPVMYESCPQEGEALPFARAFHFEMSYANEDNSTLVDLHWALMPGFFALPPAETARMWERTEPALLNGMRVNKCITLGMDDLLLILCAHGTKHIWESLGWVCDVARVLEARPDLDWTALFAQARQLRILRAFSLGLFLAADLAGAQLPDEVRRRVEADKPIRKLAQAVYAQAFENRALHAGTVASCLFYMRAREDFRDALRCCVERVFKPTMAEWRSVALPRPLYALYFLLRPLRLVGKHSARSATDPKS